MNCLSLFKIKSSPVFLEERPTAPLMPQWLWGIVTVHGMMGLALGPSNSCRAEQQALSPKKVLTHQTGFNLFPATRSQQTLPGQAKGLQLPFSAFALQKKIKAIFPSLCFNSSFQHLSWHSVLVFIRENGM